MRRVLTSRVVTAFIAVLSLIAGLVVSAVIGQSAQASTTITGVVGAGQNNVGQLGTGAVSAPVLTPVASVLPAGVTVTAVSAGYSNSAYLTSTGAVYTTGDNTAGELGNGTTSAANAPRTTPAPATFPAGVVIKAVSVGYFDMFALSTTGTVYAWGTNGSGQLGINSAAAMASTPTAVTLPAGVTITAISAGLGHSLALSSTGAVYAWGLNNLGQLGDGTVTNRPAPVLTAIPDGVTVKAIAAGFAHSLAVSSDGNVWAWGYNNLGQLGDGGTINNPTPEEVSTGGAVITAVSANVGNSVALTSTGGVMAWGDNTYGQLGNGSTTASLFATPVALGGATATAIATGFGDILIRTSTGQVLATGLNNDGQLGIGTTANALSVTAVHLPSGAVATAIGSSPYSSSSLIATSTTLATTPTTTTVTSSAATVTQGSPVTFTATVSPSDNTGTVGFFVDSSATAITGCVAAVLTTVGSAHRAVCTTTAATVGTHTITARYSGTAVFSASSGTVAGGVTVTAPNATGTVVGWGNNTSDQLGNNTVVSSALPVAAVLPAGVAVTAVAAGSAHSLALTSTGAVYAWGDNRDGNLGNGATTAAGVKNQPALVNLPAGVTAVAVSAGYFTSYVLTSTGAVYSWGLNNAGQLGDGTATNRPTPVLVGLPAGTVVRAISAGYAHALALTSAGTVYSWGLNNTGQLGAGTAAATATPILVGLPAGVTATAVSAGFEHSLALSSTGAIYAWGDNSDGELGNGLSTSSQTPVLVTLGTTHVTAVSAGYLASSALTSTGGVIAWGLNSAGQLGHGTLVNSPTPVTVNLPAGVVATAIAQGYDDGAARTSTGAVYEWGAGNLGQLGNGTTATSSTPVKVSLPTGKSASAISTGSVATHSLAVVA